MGKKSGPPAPDYTAAAQAQAASSKEVTNMQNWANRPDQFNPWGSVTWNSQAVRDPATGQMVTRWSQNTSLDPNLQGALDSQIDMQRGRSDLANSLMNRVQGEFGQPMDWSRFGSQVQGPQTERLDPTTRGVAGLNFQDLPGVSSGADARARAEDAIYRSATSRLDPQWERRQQSMEVDLANRGITRGSEAYSRAMQDFNQGRNDAYQQALLGAITGGGAEAQRDFGMDLSRRQQLAGERTTAGQFDLGREQQQFGQQMQAGAFNFGQGMQASQYANQLRQQQIAEEMQRRGFTLNEMNSLMTGQQVQAPQFQSFNTAAAAQPVNYMGAAQNQYQAALDKQNLQAGLFNNLLGGASQLGMFAFSDRRLKTDIVRVGVHPRGFGIYRYRFIGESLPRLGVIAQEVRKHAPELVRVNEGLLMVDYGRV